MNLDSELIRVFEVSNLIKLKMPDISIRQKFLEKLLVQSDGKKRKFIDIMVNFEVVMEKEAQKVEKTIRKGKRDMSKEDVMFKSVFGRIFSEQDPASDLNN